VWLAKIYGTRFDPASAATVFRPFSQNSNVELELISGQAQQDNQSLRFDWYATKLTPRVTTPSSPRPCHELFSESKPPADLL